MAKGLSIHIGLDRVDPAHYEGWDGALAACVLDAKDMQALAKKQGFRADTLLLNEAATAKAVSSALRKAAKTLGKNDILLLTYSGHGGQVSDTNGDEEHDDMDETWVLYDRQLVDDELYDLWGGFKVGVRILVLSDSCHSGTVTRDVPASIGGGPKRRAMPRVIGAKVEEAHKKLYRKIQKTHKGAEKAKVKAAVLLISGCMDNQFSMDGERNGAFTARLKQVWANGKFAGSYRQFRDKVRAGMTESQTPNYYFVGGPNRAFENEQPFTV